MILFGLTAPIFLIITVFGQDIFSFVFGDKWADAGKYAQILSLWVLFRFILSSISGIPLILKRQKTFFLFSIIFNLIPPLILFLSSIFINDFMLTLFIFVSFYTILVLVVFFWFYRLLA